MSPFWERFKRAGISEQVLAMLRRGVDRVDPRLAHACAYPAPYLPAVEQSLAYVEALVSAIPGPLQINREAFLHHPLVRALFAAPDEIQATLCRSPEARAYAEGHGGSCHGMCALLTAEHTVRNNFGPGELDGLLVRDLPRQTWSFDHHALLCPGASEADVRAALVIRLMDGLFDAVAERVARRRIEGVPTAMAKGADDRVDLGCVSGLCEKTLDFDAVLRAPEAFLALQTQEVAMDALGTVEEAAVASSAARITLVELLQQAHPPRVVTLIQCHGDGQAPSLTRGLQDVRYWMG